MLLQVIKILRTEAPDILHNFTIKPILYGSIAGVCCKIPRIINTFLGMGMIFISRNILMCFVKYMICLALRILGYYKNMIFIAQNHDDKKLLIELRIARANNAVMQCSVGVAVNNHHLLPEPKGKIVFALVARMLVDKGVREFVSAAKMLKQNGVDAEFWLVGATDNGNNQSLSAAVLERYDRQGYVKYLGYQEDVKQIWEQAHVAVLPSYREGLSRSLLEAGAYGRAVITTDAPGGRELIKHRENGLLVKPRDAKSLAEAMGLLIAEPELKKRLAKKLRSDILMRYDAQIIASKMADFYDNK